MNTSLVSLLIGILLGSSFALAGGNAVGTMGLTGSGGMALMQGFGSEDLIRYAHRASRHMPAAGVEVMGQSSQSYEMAVLGAEKHAREHCGVRRAVRTTSWVYKYDESFPGYDSGCDPQDPGFCQPTAPIRTYSAKAKFTCSN